MVKKRKTKVAILFGGKSTEHIVSLRSAENVINAIDRDKYDIVLIGIDREGRWFLQKEPKYPCKIKQVIIIGNRVMFVPGGKGELYNIDNPDEKQVIDVVFPVLHGSFGEDGTVQGVLRSANVPFVGADVLGSAIGIDKEITKRLLKEAGIPVGEFLVFRDYEKIKYEDIVYKLGLPLFVKPASLGSSIGISKVPEKSKLSVLKRAIDEAFKFDRKVLVEEYIEGREIECSVLGNEHPKASILGEIVSNDDFYSYNAKYMNKEGAELKIPANLDKEKVKEIQNLALKVYKTLSCEGLARVDFFLRKDGDILVNEINTIPGFTSINMYLKLWEESGISYSVLIDKLLQLAIDKYFKDNNVKFSIT